MGNSTEITPSRSLFLRRGNRGNWMWKAVESSYMIPLKPPSNLRKSQSTVNCGRNAGNLNCIECLYCLGYSRHTPQQENNAPWCYYNSLNPRETNIFLKNSYYFLAICFGVCLTLKEASLEFWKTRKLKGKNEKKWRGTTFYNQYCLWKYCPWTCSVHSLCNHMWPPWSSFQQRQNVSKIVRC